MSTRFGRITARIAGIPIAYHAAADQRSWENMRVFFAEIFEKP